MLVSVSKRIVAAFAAAALAAPVAPAAVAYDEVCLRNDGHYLATFSLVFADRTGGDSSDYVAGNYVANVDFSDRNDRAEFIHGKNWHHREASYSDRSRGSYPRGRTGCMTKEEIASQIDPAPVPGEAFLVRTSIVLGGGVWCNQPNNERRLDDSGNPWHRVFVWPERGGRLEVVTWGTWLRANCEVRGGDYMWEGCAQGREGFRKSACYPWRPRIGGNSAYDLTADEGKSVAHLASVARRGANLNARVNNEYPLHVAVRLDRLEHTKVLLGQGPYLNGGEALGSNRNRARLNWQNGNGESPLYLAAQLGRVNHVRALLAGRADANLVNAQGNAPIHAAALASPDGWEGMIPLLAGGGADMNAHGGDGRTPLMIAVENGESARVLTALVKEGAEPERFDRHRGFSPLHRATGHSVEALEALVASGADINVLDGGGLTPLLWASDMGAAYDIDAESNGAKKWKDEIGKRREAMALEMISLGADPAVAAEDGRHPLMVMTETGMSAAGLREVAAAGGLAATADARGFTPIHAAVRRGADVVEAVLSGGADGNTPDRNGFTPLMWAATAGEEERADWGGDEERVFGEIVDALVRGGADPETENNDGETALGLAEAQGQPEHMVAKLRQAERDANPNGLLEDGQTPLQAALAEGDEREARRLLGLGADPNLAEGDGDDNGGRRPLMIAVEERLSPEIMLALVEAGGDPALTDRHRTFTALHKATDHSPAALQALVSGGADINARDAWGRTPLFWASDLNADPLVEGTREQMALAMIYMGADPAIREYGPRKGYPLFRLVRSGMTPRGLRVVVAGGGRADLAADTRFTALHAGVKRSYLVVHALLEENQAGERADVDARDGNGFTPLMWAMDPNAEYEVGGAAEVIETLLEAGADPLAENNNGDTALSLALENGMGEEILMRLREVAGVGGG